MTPQAWTVAAIVLGGTVLFVSEKVRYDVIALLVLSLLLVSGILTPAEGLSGFSNEATLVVAAMFALNAGVVGTGALEPLIAAFTRIRRPWLLMLALLTTTAVLGAFVKNTAAFECFGPFRQIVGDDGIRMNADAVGNGLAGTAQFTTGAIRIHPHTAEAGDGLFPFHLG